MAARKIPTVPQRALANALERRREAAGLSREDVNGALEWSSMKCYRIETARVTVSPGDILQLARLYRLEDAEAEALVALARQAKRPGWWNGMSQSLPAGFSVHLELESAAYAIRTYEAQFVPGLWQTEDYARAVLSAHSVSSTPEQIERQVIIRMRRQQVLDRTSPPPPEIWAVLDEAVIRRVVGGRDVMRAPARTAPRDTRRHQGHAASTAVQRRCSHGRLRLVQPVRPERPGLPRHGQHRPPRRYPDRRRPVRYQPVHADLQSPPRHLIESRGIPFPHRRGDEASLRRRP